MKRIPPAVQVYMSTEGFFELSYGLFVKSTGEVTAHTLKAKNASIEKAARAAIVAKMKKNKYLISSSDESDPEVPGPSKRQKTK